MDKSTIPFQPSNIILDIKTQTSCDYHRILLPYGEANLNSKKPVLIFNRVFSYGIERVKQLKDKGYKIILDLDDYWSLGPTHYLFEAFKEHTKQMIEGMQLADVVTVTTELLASKVRQYNRNVVVIRNALPFDTGQFKYISNNNYSPKKNVIWAGGSSHHLDLQLVKHALDQQTSSFAGYDKNSKEWGKINNDFPKINMINVCSNQEYMSAYDNAKIAIAPLQDNLFNGCKSNLKLLEAGCKYLPFIASPVAPYYNEVDRNVVIYANNPSEWRAEINNLLKDEYYRKEKSLEVAEHVRLNYSMKDANELRRQVITSL